MKIKENKLRKIVREEVENVLNEQTAGFRADRMRAFLRKNPNVRELARRENLDLKTAYNKYVQGNAKREREYSHAL